MFLFCVQQQQWTSLQFMPLIWLKASWWVKKECQVVASAIMILTASQLAWYWSTGQNIYKLQESGLAEAVFLTSQNRKISILLLCNSLSYIDRSKGDFIPFFFNEMILFSYKVVIRPSRISLTPRKYKSCCCQIFKK